MNEAEMNKILIELGSENLTLVRLSDGKEFNAASVDKIVELLARLEMLGGGITRYGCSFADYINSSKDGRLPKYIARIRTGNKEQFRFMFSDEERSSFFVEFDNGEDMFSAATVREVLDDAGVKVQQRIGVYEIYECSQIENVLSELGKLGIYKETCVSAAENPHFTLLEKSGEGKVVAEAKIFNALEMISKIKDLGRRGIDISRYKGLGEMESDQLYDTTMDPNKRTLLKVSIEDAAAADATFSMLMGEDVPIRRAFIEDNALNTSYLDV
ncbi:MAG: hypothetical protein J6P03_05600 [Opitutales bacterium]|nr:hypothetical protein [Opitutales bacterium]